jgi:hypothetical protein
MSQGQFMTKQHKESGIRRKRAGASKQPRSGGAKASASKTQACLNLMSRQSGATLEEMQKATGWQPHSVRGLLAGKIKKMPGVTLTTERPIDGPRRYRVAVA